MRNIIVLTKLTKMTRPGSPNTRRLYSITTGTHQAMDPIQEADMLRERLILVDENDNFVGSEMKLHCHKVKDGKVPLHRAFSVIIFNSKNDLVLQHRSPTKVTYPNYVTNACCSHPLYDPETTCEDSIEAVRLAAARRLPFELGIPRDEASLEHLQFVTRLLYFSTGDGVWGEHEIDYLLVLHKDLNIKPNPNEIKRMYTVPRKEFNDFLKNLKYPLTPWFEVMIKTQWLFKIWDNLGDLEKIRNNKTIYDYRHY